MRVRLMLLADYAMAHADGRMYVVGGGFESLTFARMPGVLQQMSVAIAVAFAPSECNSDHSLELHAVAPSGDPLAPSRKIPVRPLQVPDRPAEDTPFEFVWNLRDVIFPEPGNYQFILLVDGAPCTTVTLSVAVPRGAFGALVRESEWSHSLQSGFDAYVRGDLDEAEAIFQEVVKEVPDSARAHNNLAFIKLAKGKAEEARGGFLEAARLGMPGLEAARFGLSNREVLDFNLACCEYLLGNSATALTMFQRCLRTHSLIGSAVLFGIVNDQLFPAQLTEPGDYVGLAALNAAWSSWRNGDRNSAGRLLTTAQAALGERALVLGTLAVDNAQSSMAYLRDVLDKPLA